MTYASKLKAVMQALHDASDHVASVVTNPSMVKPRNSGVTVWVQPPDLEWSKWDEAEYKFKVYIIAGRSFDHETAALEILETLEDYTKANINMSYATPATFQADGIGELAAYEVECTFDFQE